MADSEQQRIKKLKIQTGVVKRISKEKVMYEKEAQQIQGSIEKLKADGADEYAIKKQQEVLQESKAMGPDTKKRLLAAIETLKEALNEADDLTEREEYQAAKTAQEDATKLLN